MALAGLAGASPPPLAKIVQVWDFRLLWATLALGVLTLIGCVCIVLIGRWRRKIEASDSTPHDQMTGFRQLYERGELSQEEYDRIQAKLKVRLRKETIGPTAPAARPNASAPEPGPTNPPETGAAPENP